MAPNSKMIRVQQALIAAIVIVLVVGVWVAIQTLNDGGSQPRSRREERVAQHRYGEGEAGNHATFSRGQTTSEDQAEANRDANWANGNAAGSPARGNTSSAAASNQATAVRVYGDSRPLKIPGLDGLSVHAGPPTHSAANANSADPTAVANSSAANADATANDVEATTGVVCGTVLTRDADGLLVPVPGLTVAVLLDDAADTLEAISAGRRQDAITDDRGRYQVSPVRPGPVRVTIPKMVRMPDAATYSLSVGQLYYEPIVRYGLVEAGATLVVDLEVKRPFDLVGRCLTPDGLPCAQATIQVWLNLKFGQGNQPADVIAVTDADGVFRLTHLEDSEHRLIAEKSGYLTVVVEKLRPGAYGPWNPLELRFVADVSVSGMVTDDTGAAVMDARVTAEHVVEGNRTWRATVLTGTDGRYRLPVEARSVNRVTAQKAGYAASSVEGIVPGRANLNFVLRPNGQGGVAGRVLDVDGTPSTSFTVNGTPFENSQGRFDLETGPGEFTLKIRSVRTGGIARLVARVVGSELFDLGLITLSRGKQVEVIVAVEITAAPVNEPTAQVILTNVNETQGPLTNGESRFVFRAVPPDEALTFHVRHPQYPAFNKTVAPENVPEAPTPLVFFVTAGEYHATILVQDATGAPLVGARGTRVDDAGKALDSQRVSDATGEIYFPFEPNSRGTYLVAASGYASQQVTLHLGPHTIPAPRLVVTLARAGSIWGEVTARSLPLDAAVLPTIRLEVGATTRTTTPVQVVLPSGTASWRYEFHDVPPGEVWLSCVEFQLFARRPVTVVAESATRADLNLPGRGHLQVKVLNPNRTPAANLTVYLYTLDTWTCIRHGATGPDGVVRYPYLVPGGWALSVITNGSSDQTLFHVEHPDGVETLTHTLTLPDGKGAIVGRVLVEKPGVEYGEFAPLPAAFNVTAFTLAVRLPDDITVRQVRVEQVNGMTSAAAVAEAFNTNPDAIALGIVAVASGGMLMLRPRMPATLPWFSVTPADETAVQLFGAAPFTSTHAAVACKVALEYLDASLQSLLAGYVSLDDRGYFTVRHLVNGRYRPRCVPHYTNAPYAQTFGRDVVVSDGVEPFVTIWTTGAGTYADASLPLLPVLGGRFPTNLGAIIYCDNLADAPTQYPPSLSPHRGISKRSGYYFGHFATGGGAATIPRLRRGATYKAVVYVAGMLPGEITFTVSDSGAISAPPLQLQWDPRFDVPR